MATLTSSVIDSTPNFVDGTFGAKDVRLAVAGNALPGLFARGDFAVSQRAAGANMSVDVAQGRAFIDPAQATHQGVYVVRRTSATPWNTNVDGGITWTPADATNARIDLVLLELKDNAEDASGVTGFRIRVETGTPNALATHQLETAYWPSIPAGCVPIAAIRVPATATTLTTANITSLNPVGGGRAAANYTAAVETTTSAAYARLATPDALMMYVPTNGRLSLTYKSQVKISAAAGTQGLAVFINGTQLSTGVRNAAANLTDATGTMVTTWSHAGTFGDGVVSSADNGRSKQGSLGFLNSTSDVSDVATGQTLTASDTVGNWMTGTPIEIFGLAAGWKLIEIKYKTSAGTLSARERRIWAEVLA